MTRKKNAPPIELNPETRTYALYRDDALPLFNQVDLFLFGVNRSRESGSFMYLEDELPQVVGWLRQLQLLWRTLVRHLVDPDQPYEAAGLLLIDRRIRFYLSRLKALLRSTARFFYLD